MHLFLGLLLLYLLDHPDHLHQGERSSTSWAKMTMIDDVWCGEWRWLPGNIGNISPEFIWPKIIGTLRRYVPRTSHIFLGSWNSHGCVLWQVIFKWHVKPLKMWAQFWAPQWCATWLTHDAMTGIFPIHQPVKAVLCAPPWSMGISGSNTWRYVNVPYHIFGHMNSGDIPWN